MDQNLSVINELLPVLTAGNTGIWTCDTSSGQISFSNDFFGILELTGVKFSSLNELQAIIHTDDLPDFDQAFAGVSSGKNITVDYRCRFDDHLVQLESTLMYCGKSVVACTRNKSRTLQLQRLKKQYKSVVNAMFPNFSWVFDYDFYIVDIIMPDGLKLFHNRKDLIGTDARNYYSPEVNELIITNNREALKTKKWRQIEYYIDLMGTRYYYQSRIVPLDENKVICLCIEIGDRVRRMDELLTQRQRAEESDRMKNVFIANMSHEIRTPLNAITGFSEFLMKEVRPSKRKAYMDIVRTSTVLLRQIVSDILDLSRLDAGMIDLVFEETDIVALSMEVAEVFASDMKPGVRFLIDIPDGDIQAPTDANRVKQVLNNLITNAIKHTEKGSISLKLEKSDEYLTFSIADTGCGISEDKLEIIFDRFEKLNRFTQGTGLGLAISKIIVDRLGGTFVVTSKVGEGSVFSFNIPYRSIVSNAKNPDDAAAIQRKKILLSEKSEENLRFVREILLKKYDILEITDDEKLINAVIFDQPNLMLVDMNVANKKEIIHKIRAISAKIPIIAMTSSDYYHDQRQAFDNDCTDVIAKPFTTSKLEEIVMAFIV